MDVIHTDGGKMGFLEPLGHADFYPNGGVDQLCSCEHECPDTPCDGSDHRRAPIYYRLPLAGIIHAQNTKTCAVILNSVN